MILQKFLKPSLKILRKNQINQILLNLVNLALQTKKNHEKVT